ncbi:MAG: DNA-processing protein DprA [Halioglobus sp.]
MNVMDARLCLALHCLPGLGDISLARLFHHYGTPANIWNSLGDWPALAIPSEIRRAAAVMQKGRFREFAGRSIDAQIDVLQRFDAEVLSLSDADYPALLRTIYDPPPILYLRGDRNLLQSTQLAVVGSRKASSTGLRAAVDFSRALTLSGVQVSSGLALGIDQAAHRGALDAGGNTVAVMATGIDRIYPARHCAIANEILCAGCLVTEFPPGTAPLPQNFPRRNRILSGLSLGVLVIEAALRSGSLITARTAMEQGREVFALPWSISHPAGRGCLSLLRDGVKMVLTIEDILEELGALACWQQQNQCTDAGSIDTATALSPIEADVMALIGGEAVGVDELVQHCDLDVAGLLAILSRLEYQSMIERFDGGYIRS